MSIEQLSNGWFKIDFEKTDGVHTYKDALHLSAEDYESKTEEEIEAMKQQRFDNWIAVITAPPPETPAPTEQQPE